jgi:hypothetical protein
MSALTPEQQAIIDRVRARRTSSASPAGAAKEEEGPIGWGDVAAGAVTNLLPSAGQVISDTVTPFLDPVGTAKSVGKMAVGAVQKAIPGEQGYEKNADAIMNHFAERYGSMEGFKKALRDDPAGVAADLSIPFTGGGAALARAPGMVGKVGRATRAMGSGMDAANLAAKGAGVVGSKVVAPVIGMGTGTGARPIEVAAKAGYKTGTGIDPAAGAAFREHLTDPSKMTEVVDDAKNAMSRAYQDRSAQYTSDMQAAGLGTQPLPFGKVFNAALSANNLKTFKGIDYSPATLPVRKEISDAVDKWSQLDPKTYHTAEGLDKLKQWIGEIRDQQELGKPGFKMADTVYKSVEKEILDAAPKYKEAMSNYADSSRKLDDIKGTLSLGRNARTDTSLRKLQSVMRDNVNTNWGARASLVKDLEKYSPHLSEKLAGQSLQNVVPRGLAASAGKYGLMAGAGYAIPPLAIPLGVGAALTSPRLVGEAAYWGGRGVGAASKYTPKAVKSVMSQRPTYMGSRAAGMLAREAEEAEEEEKKLLGGR